VESVIGSDFDDVIRGRGEAEVLSGGAGNDLISGGRGSDTLSGGAGDDVFVFTQRDARGGTDFILDFSAGDAIDLSDFFAGSGPDVPGDVIRGVMTEIGLMLQVDVGSRTYDVAILQGVIEIDASTQFADGLLFA